MNIIKELLFSRSMSLEIDRLTIELEAAQERIKELEEREKAKPIDWPE